MRLFFYSVLVLFLNICINITAQTTNQKNNKKEQKLTTSTVKEDKNNIIDYGEVVKVIADEAGEFSDGLCSFQRDGKWGFINTHGQIVIEPKYLCTMDVPVFRDSVTRLYDPSSKAWGYLGLDGGLAVPFKFYHCTNYDHGFALNYKPGSGSKVGPAHVQIITKFGIVLIENAPCDYTYETVFKEGLARIDKSGSYGFMNVLGMVIGDNNYSDVRDFSDSMAAVQRDNKWGFIDKTGTLKVPLMFVNEPQSFSCDRAFVMGSNNLYGIIDKEGKIIVEPKYQQVFPFENDVAVVSMMDKGYNENFLIIDINGKVIKDFPKPKKDDDKIAFFSGFKDGLAIVQKGYSMERGFMDTKGKMVTGFDFNILKSFQEGLAYAEKFDGKTNTRTKGFINKKGKWVIQIEKAQF
jgi:hypothetical protein